jgi:hypothetical protein
MTQNTISHQVESAEKPPRYTQPLNSTRGRNEDELMAQLIEKSRDESGKVVTWRCLEFEACRHERKGSPTSARVLKHALSCKFIRERHSALYQAAYDASDEGSLGAQLEKNQQISKSIAGDSGCKPSRLSKAKSFGPLTASKRPKIGKIYSLGDITLAADSFLTTQRQLDPSQGTLDILKYRAAGEQSKASTKEVFKKRIDHIIMRLICVRGLVPNVLDSPEWKELVTTLNGSYSPTSASTFQDKYIPQEAAHIRKRQLECLRKEQNITITFDGTTTRKPHSFYTAHATTSHRESFFLDGYEGSDERHNADWIKDRLFRVSQR